MAQEVCRHLEWAKSMKKAYEQQVKDCERQLQRHRKRQGDRATKTRQCESHGCSPKSGAKEPASPVLRSRSEPILRQGALPPVPSPHARPRGATFDQQRRDRRGEAPTK